jgi:hypothetical protein
LLPLQLFAALCQPLLQLERLLQLCLSAALLLLLLCLLQLWRQLRAAQQLNVQGPEHPETCNTAPRVVSKISGQAKNHS